MVPRANGKVNRILSQDDFIEPLTLALESESLNRRHHRRGQACNLPRPHPERYLGRFMHEIADD